MRTIDSEDGVRELLAQRQHRTRTYRVPDGSLARLPLDNERRLREIDDAELQEVADFLEVDRGELHGPFKVVEASCPNCERRLGFVDFIRTAVQTDVHDRDRLREVLTGRAGSWLTIRGLDGGRPVICGDCGLIARLPNGYSEYSSSSYAYA
jgi:hypothetical protein